MITPYVDPPLHWCEKKWHEYQKIISSFVTFDVPADLQQLVLEALHDSKTWDWYNDCNGANLVSECGWKGIYHPVYVRHDYDWTKSGPSIASNNTMYRLQLAYGMDKWRSLLRWAGVTLVGLPVHKFFMIFKK